MKKVPTSITSVCLALFVAACGSGSGGSGGSGGASNGGSSGNPNGGNTVNPNSGNSGSGGNIVNSNGGNSGSGGNTVNSNGGNSGSGGNTVNPNGGSGGNSSGGATGNGGSSVNPDGGAGGKANGGTMGGGSAGTIGTGGSQTGGVSGSGGVSSTGGTTTTPNTLVTSASGAYWKTGTWTEVTSSATVTVNDGSTSQTWDGFGGCFNELGWSYLTSKTMQDQAIKLLFSDDGCRFTWGRVPMGASDYASSRYTLDDTGSDVAPDSSESNRPAADTSLGKFSLDRDGQKLIPYIKAALAVKPDIRFWASPWTPPGWMKTGHKKDIMGSSGSAKKPSYFDGGSMKSDSATLTAYAQYYTKFVQGYKDQGINIQLVSPQNEPGYELNYRCSSHADVKIRGFHLRAERIETTSLRTVMATL
jgi:glucosylceramidase